MCKRKLSNTIKVHCQMAAVKMQMTKNHMHMQKVRMLLNKHLLRTVDIYEHHQKIASADLWNDDSGVVLLQGRLLQGNVHTKEPEVGDSFHTIRANEQGLEFCSHPPEIKDSLLHLSAVQNKVILHGPHLYILQV